MRFLQVLFAFYILLLSLMPCTDASSSAHEECTQTEACAQSDSENAEHEDTCTPLCSCNCCGSIMIIAFSERIGLVPVPSFPNPKQSFLNQLAYSIFNHSIWQPPKI